MPKKIRNYKIIEAQDANELERQVNQFMNDQLFGHFNPIGGVSVAMKYKGGQGTEAQFIYSQAFFGDYLAI